MFKRVHEESARPARGVEHGFPEFGIHHIDNEAGERTRCIKFAIVARALKTLQKVFVYLVEVMPIVTPVEINLIDLVDYLTNECARSHVIGGIVEDLFHEKPETVVGRDAEILEFAKEFGIDEIEELVPGDPFRIGCPVAPAEVFGNR